MTGAEKALLILTLFAIALIIAVAFLVSALNLHPTVGIFS